MGEGLLLHVQVLGSCLCFDLVFSSGGGGVDVLGLGWMELAVIVSPFF